MNRFIVAIAFLINFSYAAINECKQYMTCPECLDLKNVTAPFEYGNRPNCGWCHVPITYEDGHKGARCADVRDDPWNCGDQYDTATCSPGWACDETQGKCIMANPGDGFGSKSTCENYCGGGPPGGGGGYRCNTTNYICQECKKGESGCSPDRATECSNCKDPDPTKLFKCNRTDADHPKCEECKSGNHTGCMSRGQACNSCAPKPDLYECDKKTLTCIKAKQQGNIKQACNAECGHHTPQELLGTWRGLMAKKGEANHFDMGEIDMIFGDKNLTVKYPNRTQDIYDVATTGGSVLILQKGGQTINVAHNVLAYLKHTQAMGLSTYGPNKPAPDTFKTGMDSEKALSGIMWKCNSWGGQGTCHFRNSTKPHEEEESEEVAVIENTPEVGSDECNSFGDCHTCIGAHQGVKCGWCLGGTLSYRGIGKTVFKCGGFRAGEPYNFTCPADFRTTDCKGYACDFRTKKCAESDDGQFPDALSCEEACQKDVSHSKCNLETKKCDKCTQGSPDCNTAAFCAATCGKPHGKCDPGTGKCSPCEPGKDKDCTQVKTACDQECTKQALSKCNSDTGKCDKCTSGAGCVPTAACEKTCSHNPHPENYPYKCSWNATEPKCVQEKTGTMNKTECMQTCNQVPFGKCNFKNNTCEKCDHTKDKDCTQIMSFCKVEQQEGRCKEQKLNGLYRMIEVQPDYDEGEFDVQFKDGKMIMQDFTNKIDAKDLGTIKSTGAADGGGVTFEVHDWKPEPKIWGKEQLFGVYKTSPGESHTFTFLEMAFSDKKITQLDAGLKGRYFVGAACVQKKNANGDMVCDFTKATPQAPGAEQSSQYAKFKFLLG